LVGIKPEKLYPASCFWREVKPLGKIAHRLRHFYVRETKTATQTTYLSISAESYCGVEVRRGNKKRFRKRDLHFFDKPLLNLAEAYFVIFRVFIQE